MVGLFDNSLKLLHKNKRLGILILGLMSLSACASLSSSEIKPKNNAPSNIEKNAQSDWEQNGALASSDYHFTLAQAYSSEGKVDRAIEEYRAALTYDSHSAVLHAKLAAEYVRKGSMSFAIDECKQALAIDATLVDVHLMLGGIYSVSNEMDKAILEYDWVLKADPTNDEAAVFKTQVLVEQEKTDEALKFVRSFNTRVGDSAAAWFYAGKLEQMKEHYEAAVAAYRKALELRPGFSQASLALGLVFELHSDNKKAVEVYEAQIEEKQDLQVSGRLVTLYLKAGQTAKALSLLQAMAALDPEDLNTQLRVGLLYMQKEDWTSAKQTFESLLQKVPDSDKVHYYLAAVLEQQGQTSETIVHLSKVSADSKLFEDANLHIAGLYRKSGNKEKAFQALKDAVVKSPENPGFYLTLASLYEDEKKYKDAGQSLSEGLKVFPDDEKMRYFYGAVLDKLGKQDEAVLEMEKIIMKSPNNADALNFVAYTWTTQGVRLKDAEDMLKRALKLKPNNPFILDSLGWNQFMLGKNQDALIYLEKAAGIKTDEEAILEHLVQVYAKNQMPERAQAAKVRIKHIREESVSRAPASEVSE